jgi:gamma-glutamylcyclotransferase (GGCT)/AIG2-like uncharacterized protein YtfP
MKMFAYGMNTNTAEMDSRCPAAICLGKATMPNHEFRFAVHADVVVSPGNSVDGVLWDITPDCMAALDMLEGFPFYYLRKKVKVLVDGKQTKAMVYYMVPGHEDSPPSKRYLALLLEGYKEHGVPTKQIYNAIT